jgi:SAM-dependent methyltransferase
MMTYDDAQCAHEITYWERVGNTRWGAYISDIEKRAILKANDLSKRPTAGIEIGCDGGRWSKLLTDLGWNMVCTDINEESLKICEKRIPAAKCILVRPDDNILPCVSESVDLVLCVEVAPVMQSDWVVCEWFRVLRNDGLVVGVFKNLLSIRGLFAHVIASLSDSFDYYKNAYPLWRRKLSDSGFLMLHEEGYCWFPFRRASDSLFVPYIIRVEKGLGLRKLPVISPWIVFIAQKKIRRNTRSSS